MKSAHDALNATAIPRRPEPGLLPAIADRAAYLLPHPGTPCASLAEALVGRRSHYSFGSWQPSIDHLSTLLHLGVATAPSAGGLSSVVPHLVARGPAGLPLGVYRADPRYPLPNLTQVRTGDPTRFIEASLEQPPFATRVPLWIALAIDTAVSTDHYPPRHYRTLHLDAGVAMQNLLLVATALGLATCPVMGYDDHAWSELLALGDQEMVAGIIALG